MIALRLIKMSMGGVAAQKEAEKMVTEKMLASMEAATTLAVGGITKKSFESLPYNYADLRPAS